MPPRKRHKRQPEHPDPVVRFARALQDARERERAEQIRVQAEREEQKRLATIAAEHAARLAKAQRRLDAAIAGVKTARSANAESRRRADEEYRAAKALVLELETGERPGWAPGAADQPSEPTG